MKENLREAEKNSTLENDLIQQPEVANDKLKVDIEDDATTKEAWIISEFKPSKADSLTMLAIIGKVPKILSICNRDVFVSEKKVLPLTVLFASIGYFAIAASFYFE